MSQGQSARIRQGFTDSLGVGLGLFPLGVALGILVSQAGLPLWVAPALSLFVFAGSVELLLVSLISLSTPLITIGFTVFALNFRHVFYPLNFPIQVIKSPLARAYSVFGMIDEAYATYVLMPANQLSGTRMVTGQLLMQAYWVSGSIAGVAVGALLPFTIEGFEFALVALFLVMAIDAIRSHTDIITLLLAAASFIVAIVAFSSSLVLASLVSFTVMLVARYWWWSARTHREESNE